MLALSSRSSRRVTLLGSRRALVIARLLGAGRSSRWRSNPRRCSNPQPWRASHSPKIHRGGCCAAHSSPAGFDDRCCRWRPARNCLDERNAARGRGSTHASAFAKRASCARRSSVEGVFRILLLSPGHYEFRVEAEGFAPFVIPDLALNANEVTTLEISLVGISSAEFRSRLPRLPELGPAIAAWLIACAWQLS